MCSVFIALCFHCRPCCRLALQMSLLLVSGLIADLLKKLKNECIKSMDDAPYKAAIAKLESFTMELREFFPVLNSAVGTVSISVPGIALTLSNVCTGWALSESISLSKADIRRSIKLANFLGMV